MKRHNLKCWPEPFEAILEGSKVHEFRREDGESFEVGDVLWLAEWSPITGMYSGREVRRRVTYVSRGPAWGIPPGHVCMSLRPNPGSREP